MGEHVAQLIISLRITKTKKVSSVKVHAVFYWLTFGSNPVWIATPVEALPAAFELQDCSERFADEHLNSRVNVDALEYFPEHFPCP